MSNLYEDMGKLLFETGLPQVFGLYPNNEMVTQKKDDLAVFLGMLNAITDGEKFVEVNDLSRWRVSGLRHLNNCD